MRPPPEGRVTRQDGPDLVLTSQVPVGGRESHDHYPTPRSAIDALLRVWMPAPGFTVLDPCCGEGAILDVFRGRGLVTLGIELDPTRAAEAEARGHQVDRGDALGALHPWPEADWLISNPPYTLAREFAEKAILWSGSRGPWNVALLLRLSFLEPASGRGDLFRNHPPNVRILPRRPAFDGRGTDSITSAWFCWPGTGRLMWLP